MSLNPNLISAVAATTLVGVRGNLEPLDCTTPPALDLCTRRKDSLSPCPEGARHAVKHSPDTNTYINTEADMYGSPCYRSEAEYTDDASVSSGSVSEFTNYPITPVTAARSKTARPFKAYPKDPFFLAIGAGTADAILGKESAEAFADFRQKMLQQVRANNPMPGVTNAKMRRSSIPSAQEYSGKDASYWEKRRKNNEAAKRSRDARRAKEDEIAIRAAFLEQENLKLKYENAALRNETTKLRCMLYN